MAVQPRRSAGWLHAGLFLATLATLILENLDSRLLSVLTWYHLSFFAVSLAMLGMAAGAMFVFLRGDAFRGQRAESAVVRFAIAMAASIPLTHVANLLIPLPPINVFTVSKVGLYVAGAVVLAIPFFLSGVVVTIVLTRIGGVIGRLYASDLLGASAGCLVIIPLLEFTDISSAAFVCGALSAAAAACFVRFTGHRRLAASLIVGVGCVVGAATSAMNGGLGITLTAKGTPIQLADVEFSAWNSHSFVVGLPRAVKRAFYWGPGKGARRLKKNAMRMYIDGAAGTAITEWNGDPGTLDWVKRGITYLPYELRTGDVAIVGVGGGRDILSAVASGASSITAVEVNEIFLDLLRGPYRAFGGIADREEVTLIHDEGRAYLTRTDRYFDVLQMSLVDTWAATGAGAFTLSESSLYTREGWRIFLGRLKPDGVLSISRWFQPDRVSETSRLLALGVAALLDRGVDEPNRHLILVSRRKVANLLVSPSPFGAEDVATIRRISDRHAFSVLAAPGIAPADERMRNILASEDHDDLDRAVADDYFDYTPPTDERPYFFNMLKPAGLWQFAGSGSAGIVEGNLVATQTLLMLLFVASLLVVVIIVFPLFSSGMPGTDRADFAALLLYFALIGFGFILVQIALVQRFTPFLGLPTYALSIALFSTIFFAGIGSLLSDRFDVSIGSRIRWVPLFCAGVIAAGWALIPAVVEAGGHASLPIRCALAVIVTAPLATTLGLFFPVGLRLAEQIAPDATAWTWGVNGACGVLGSILAAAISMWLGVGMNLAISAVLYAALTWPLLHLMRAHGTDRQ